MRHLFLFLTSLATAFGAYTPPATSADGVDNTSNPVNAVVARSFVDSSAATRQPLDEVYLSNGVTGGRRVEWTLGAAGNVAGSSITVRVFNVIVPTDSVASDRGLFLIGSGHGVYDGGLRAVWFSNDLIIRQQLSAGNHRSFVSSSFRETYAGQRGEMVIVFAGNSTTSPAVYWRGVDVSALFGASTSNTAPNWVDAAMSSDVLVGGFTYAAGEMPIPTIINRALTAAEVAQMVQTGALLPVDRSGGSAVELFPQTSGAWSSVATGVTTVSSYDLVTDPDGVGVPAGVSTSAFALKIVRTGSSGFGGTYVAGDFFRQNFRGSRIAFNLFAKQTVGASTTAIISSDGNQTIDHGGTDTTVATGTGWEALDRQITARTAVGNAGPALFNNGDFTLYVVRPSAKALGALLQPEITRTAQLLDNGPNRILGVTASGVFPLTPKTEGQIAETLTWSGTHEAKSLLGGVPVPSNIVITDIITKASTSSSGSGVTVGSVNNNSLFVSANTFGTTTKVHTLATGVPAGTTTNDLVLTLDPDTINFTGSIDITVFYRVVP